MLQVRCILFLTRLIVMFFVCFVLSVSYVAAERFDNVRVNWFSGGEAKITLKRIVAGGEAYSDITGKTSQKTLMIKVVSPDGSVRNNRIPLEKDGSFNVRYMFKDGVGKYAVTLFGSAAAGALNFQGLSSFTVDVNKPLPADLSKKEINAAIVGFVNAAMGRKIGRGECWDLAQEALDSNLADWTRTVDFGVPVNPAKEPVKAGDIIQFRSLVLTESLPGGVVRRETLGSPDHTAIIYKVNGDMKFTLAHQNVSGKRVVILSDINLANVTQGTFWIYRPIARMIPPSKFWVSDSN